MIYTSQKAHFVEYTSGTPGISYTLSLDNDFDMVVFDQQNNRISTLPTVTATRMLNGDTTTVGSWGGMEIASNVDWAASGHYTFSNGVLVITAIPEGFTYANFTFTWNIDEDVSLKKTFSLKKHISEVDYNLVVPKTIVNSTYQGDTIFISVNKKDLNGITTITTEEDLPSGFTLEGVSTDTDGRWYVSYEAGHTEAVTITLTQGNITWDQETIEFVVDGSDGVDGEGEISHYCLRTIEEAPTYPAPENAGYSWSRIRPDVSKENPYLYVVSFPVPAYEDVAKKINTYKRAYSQEAWEHYGAIGWNENWTISTGTENVPIDNSHIVVGDYAYIEGVVTDKADQPVVLYGRVIDTYLPSTEGGRIRMTSVRLDFGRTSGSGETSRTGVLCAQWAETPLTATRLFTSSIGVDDERNTYPGGSAESGSAERDLSRVPKVGETFEARTGSNPIMLTTFQVTEVSTQKETSGPLTGETVHEYKAKAISQARYTGADGSDSTVPGPASIHVYHLSTTFYSSKNGNIPAVLSGTSLNSNWKVNKPSFSGDSKYLYAAMVQRSGTDGSYTYSNAEEPQLIEVNVGGGVSSEEYATFLRLTEGNTRKGIIKNPENGNIYINASYINSGALSVTKSGMGGVEDSNNADLLFYAGPDGKGKNIVKLGSMVVEAGSNLKEDIENIQVGGRNLLLGTEGSVTNSNYPIAVYNLSTALTDGETYTFSCDATLGAGAHWIALYHGSGSGDAQLTKIETLGTEKKHYTHTFTWYNKNGSNPNDIWIYLLNEKYNGQPNPMPTSTITNVQLEKGNKATDWTPAPEDVDDKINEKPTVFTDVEEANSSAKKEGDLLIPSNTWGGYVQGKIYRFTETNKWEETAHPTSENILYTRNLTYDREQSYCDQISKYRWRISTRRILPDSPAGETAGLIVPFNEMFEQGKTYIVSYKFVVNACEGIRDIGGHHYGWVTEKFILDGVEVTTTSQENGEWDGHCYKYATPLVYENGKVHTVEWHLRNVSANVFYIQANRNTENSGKTLTANLDIYDLQIQEGTTSPTLWKPCALDEYDVDNLLRINDVDLLAINGVSIAESGGSATYDLGEDTLTFNADTSTQEIYYRFCRPIADAMSLFVPGETYEFSGTVSLVTTSGTLTSLNVRTEAHYTDPNDSTKSGWRGGIGTKGRNDYGIILTSTASDVSFTKTFTVEDGAEGYYLSIQLYYDSAYTGTITLKNLSLKKVTTSLNTNSNDFSWKFSPTEGMMMWNGVQGSGDTGETDAGYIDPNLVFKIGEIPDGNGGTAKGLYMRGNGEFTGNITAESGDIGGWALANNNLTKGDAGQSDSFHIRTTDFPEAVYIANNGMKNWRLTIGDSFGVSSSGGLYAGSGSIGGWHIYPTRLCNSVGFGTNAVDWVGISTSDYDTFTSLIDGRQMPVRFFAGASSILGTDGKFMVLNDGSLYATAADITGTITAKEGYIGGKENGWAIKEGSITCGEFDDGESFHMYSTGYAGEKQKIQDTGEEKWMLSIGKNFGVTDGGSLYCGGGTIRGKIITSVIHGDSFQIELKDSIQIQSLQGIGVAISPTLISYKGTEKIRFEKTTADENVLGQITTNNLWCLMSIPNNSGKISYTFWWQDSLGNMISSPFTGKFYLTWEPYKSSGIPFDNVEKEISSSEFSDSTGPKKVSISVELPDGIGTGGEKTFSFAIRLNSKDSATVYFDTDIRYGDYGDEYTTSKVVYVYTEQDSSFVFVSGHVLPSISGSISDDSKGYNLGHSRSWKWRNLYAKNAYFDSHESDARVKNSVSTLPIEYEFFFDKMQPTRYKYNNGTSNRYHTGFIAQQLVSVLEESGLTTQDFAGVVLDNPGTEDECWYLRRDEFVALNTWQIQKLKPRVSALEQTILNYESRISALETEIQNLKSI